VANRADAAAAASAPTAAATSAAAATVAPAVAAGAAAAADAAATALVGVVPARRQGREGAFGVRPCPSGAGAGVAAAARRPGHAAAAEGVAAPAEVAAWRTLADPADPARRVVGRHVPTGHDPALAESAAWGPADTLQEAVLAAVVHSPPRVPTRPRINPPPVPHKPDRALARQLGPPAPAVPPAGVTGPSPPPDRTLPAARAGTAIAAASRTVRSIDDSLLVTLAAAPTQTATAIAAAGRQHRGIEGRPKKETQEHR